MTKTPKTALLGVLLVLISVPLILALSTTYSSLGTIKSDKNVYSCYPSCQAFVNITLTNASRKGVQLVTVNLTAVSGVTYRIEWMNGTVWKVATQNNTGIAKFNLSQVGVNKLRFNISMKRALSSRFNVSIRLGTRIDNYTLGPLYLDSINLSAPANATTFGASTVKFNFTLFSNAWKKQNCTLYVGGAVVASNKTTSNGSLTVLTKAYTATQASTPWFISCNATGNSITRYFAIDATAPALTSNRSNVSGVNIGESMYLITKWTDASTTQNNLTCKLYIRGALNQTKTTTATAKGDCNFTYATTSIDYPSFTWYVNATDIYGNTRKSSTFTAPVNLTCGTTITTSITLNRDHNCAATGGTALQFGKSKLIVNCAGYSLIGNNGTSIGALISNKNDNKISNCIIKDFGWGVKVNGTSTRNNITVSKVQNNVVGIQFDSAGNKLRGLNFTSNTKWAVNTTAGTTEWMILGNNIITKQNINMSGNVVFGANSILTATSSNLTLNGTKSILDGTMTGFGYISKAVTRNTSTQVVFTAINTNITLFLLRSITAQVVVDKKTPTSAPSGDWTVVKAIDILPSNATRRNLTWAIVRIYYNSTELSSANVEENTLKLYYYNTTVGDWQLESRQGQDNVANYVWANVTHFSIFGIFGTTGSRTTGASTGGHGGGGNNVYDGVAPITPYVPEYVGPAATAAPAPAQAAQPTVKQAEVQATAPAPAPVAPAPTPKKSALQALMSKLAASTWLIPYVVGIVIVIALISIFRARRKP